MDFLNLIYDHPLTCNYDCDNTGTTDILYMRLQLIHMQTNEKFNIGIGIPNYDGKRLGEIDLYLNSCQKVSELDFESIAAKIFEKLH
ncbi:MAG: hypothetical protein ACXWCZ_12350 [Flavisolibacter sp.]